jgi:hypothetical protein
MRHTTNVRRDFAFDAPENDKCGTCLGRYWGHVNADGLMFAPRDHWKPPTWCPGWDADGPDPTCLLCGHRIRYGGRYYSAACRHHIANVDLFNERARPCPRHGWRELRRRGDRLFCWAWDTHGRVEPYCGWDGGPR